jgi:hypothetical protein
MMEPLLSLLRGSPVSVKFQPWKALRVGGYDKKMKFAVRVAFDERLDGVVAWADDDGANEDRLKKLRGGRNETTQTLNVPAAVGVAVPHAEAWILDDPAAVRQVLGMEQEEPVPSVKVSQYPKTTLNVLCAQHCPGVRVMELLPRFCQALQPSRMVHSTHTGFEAFQKDFEDRFPR